MNEWINVWAVVLKVKNKSKIVLIWIVNFFFFFVCAYENIE